MSDLSLPPVSHREIEAFRAVMVSGTTTGAAVLLHTSQPVISKLIAHLQRSSGVKLFELRKSRLVPTPEARILFNTVERSYTGLHFVQQTLAELKGAHAGRVAVGCLPSFAMGVLPSVVQQFLATYPGSQVGVETVNSSLMKQSVISGKLDLAIIQGGVDTSGVQATPLISVDTVCLMSASHPLAHRDSVSVHDLHGQPFIAHARHSVVRAHIDQLFERHKVVPQTVAESTYAMMAGILALGGVGAALASPFILPHLEKAGLLAKPFEPSLPIQLLLLTPLEYPPSSVCQRFMDVLYDSLEALARDFTVPVTLHPRATG